MSEYTKPLKRVSMDVIESMPVLLTTKEAASIIGVSPFDIANGCARGNYAAVKCGSAWRINKTKFLQQFGLIDDDGQEEDAVMSIQESLNVDNDDVFDYSSGLLIGGSSGRAPINRTYIIFSTNGYKAGTDEPLKTATLSMCKKDGNAIIERYGTSIGIHRMPDTHEIVLHEGDDRTITTSGKARRLTVSIGTMRNELEEALGHHKKIYVQMKAYANCFVFTPTGEYSD